MADERGLDHVHWRLDDHDKRLDRLVSRDVYDADQKGSDARHARTERDVDRVYERIRTLFWVGGGGIAATVLADFIRAVRGDR